MRPELGLRLLAVALAGVTAAVTGGCSGGDPPLRIGVVADCVGVQRPFHDGELAGAELPLLERGAELKGGSASEGVTPAEVAGRKVEIVPGCTEVWEFSALTAEVRRLAEREHVDAIVAASTGPDEVVLRQVAKLYPRIVFLAVSHGAREVTLRDPPPNLFRVLGDHGQGVAGLATYAYRKLGWRRAAVVNGDWDEGWDARDAFVAEFCAIGGEITDQLSYVSFDPRGNDVADVPRGVDGIAVFAPAFHGPTGFLRRLAARVRNPARQIVVGPALIDDPVLLADTDRALDGVVGSSQVEPARMRRFLGRFARAFPGIPTDVARSPLVTTYRDAVEALLTALEDADGSTAGLPAKLARSRTDLLGGPVRLDRNRQATTPTWLVRIHAPGAGGGGPTLTPVREIPGVDQSIGGLLPDSLISAHAPARCRAARQPPPWAG
jgi:branched-chain amino acid transport system substrate-binding protein